MEKVLAAQLAGVLARAHLDVASAVCGAGNTPKGVLEAWLKALGFALEEQAGVVPELLRNLNKPLHLDDVSSRVAANRVLCAMTALRVELRCLASLEGSGSTSSSGSVEEKISTAAGSSISSSRKEDLMRRPHGSPSPVGDEDEKSKSLLSTTNINMEASANINMEASASSKGSSSSSSKGTGGFLSNSIAASESARNDQRDVCSPSGRDVCSPSGRLQSTTCESGSIPPKSLEKPSEKRKRARVEEDHSSLPRSSSSGGTKISQTKGKFFEEENQNQTKRARTENTKPQEQHTPRKRTEGTSSASEESEDVGMLDVQGGHSNRRVGAAVQQGQKIAPARTVLEPARVLPCGVEREAFIVPGEKMRENGPPRLVPRSLMPGGSEEAVGGERSTGGGKNSGRKNSGSIDDSAEKRATGGKNSLKRPAAGKNNNSSGLQGTKSPGKKGGGKKGADSREWTASSGKEGKGNNNSNCSGNTNIDNSVERTPPLLLSGEERRSTSGEAIIYNSSFGEEKSGKPPSKKGTHNMNTASGKGKGATNTAAHEGKEDPGKCSKGLSVGGRGRGIVIRNPQKGNNFPPGGLLPGQNINMGVPFRNNNNNNVPPPSISGSTMNSSTMNPATEMMADGEGGLREGSEKLQGFDGFTFGPGSFPNDFAMLEKQSRPQLKPPAKKRNTPGKSTPSKGGGSGGTRGVEKGTKEGGKAAGKKKTKGTRISSVKGASSAATGGAARSRDNSMLLPLDAAESMDSEGGSTQHEYYDENYNIQSNNNSPVVARKNRGNPEEFTWGNDAGDGNNTRAENDSNNTRAPVDGRRSPKHVEAEDAEEDDEAEEDEEVFIGDEESGNHGGQLLHNDQEFSGGMEYGGPDEEDGGLYSDEYDDDYEEDL